MPVRVHIPSLLMHLFNTQKVVEVKADSVAQMVAALDDEYPGIGERLLEPDGSLRRYVNVFIDGEDARWQGEAAARLRGEEEVWIVPNVAGGLPGLASATAQASRNGSI